MTFVGILRLFRSLRRNSEWYIIAIVHRLNGFLPGLTCLSDEQSRDYFNFIATTL